ncbi:MAG: hypothetical protein M3Z84_08110 [Actinomycetota bacterium]|nr:hypothetical protein [Actinomycetota bacterium]
MVRPRNVSCTDVAARSSRLQDSRDRRVFTQTIHASKQAASALQEAGLGGAAAIHSGLDRASRQSVLAGFRDGALRVVTAPQVLDEGVDVPAADLAVILASSRSRRQMIQRMGRVLRRKPDGTLASSSLSTSRARSRTRLSAPTRPSWTR